MAEQSAYDLMVLLDPETPEERRTEIIDRIKQQIDGGGATLKGDADWGMRRLAFEIDHRGEAQYHLFQFEAAAELLNELDRTLSIDDAVLRHRIIRLPGPAPDSTPRPSADEGFRREERAGRGPRGSDARRDEPAGEDQGEAADAQAAPQEDGEAAPSAEEPAQAAAPAPESADTASGESAEGEPAPPPQPAQDDTPGEERETS
jgi:small subunit ribosomal protein S6